MAPKAKPKAKAGAAKAAAAKPKAEPKAKSKAAAKAKAGSSPAAGSGAAAVRQSREEAAAAAEAAAEAEAKAPVSTEPDGAAAERSSECKEDAASKTRTEDAAAAANTSVPAVREAPEPKDDDKGSEHGSGDDAGKATDAADCTTVIELDLSTVPDPWESIADDAAMSMLREEEWEVVELEGEAPRAASHLAARDAELPCFRASEEQRRWLVSADLAGNSIESIAAAGAPLWIRMLNLANNPLSSFAGLADGFPRLIVLDLSFVDLPSVDGSWSALASCQRLRRLTAEGCGVSSFDDLEPLPQLRTLEIMDNGIEEFEEVAALAKKCSGIEELDLRENDVVTTGNYVKKVRALFPKLTFLDNQSQKAYVAKRQDEAYKGIEGMDKDIMAVDGMYKNESCSCLEGNPCVSPETCKDWRNREKVAAEARKRKALRDDYGKICD